MKRALLLVAAVAAFLAFSLPAHEAQAAVSVGVSINTGYRSGFSLSFASRPNVVLIPRSRVYYVSDFDEDLYCYDDDWYYCDDGTWYTGPSYDGPFVQVAFTSIPYAIRTVPVSYRRHWSGYSTQTYGQSYPTRRYDDRSTTWNRSDDRDWNTQYRTTVDDRNDRGKWNDRDGRGPGNSDWGHERSRNHGNGHGRGRHGGRG